MWRRKCWISAALPVLSVVLLTACRHDGSDRRIDPASRQFTGQYPIRVVCTTGPVTDLLRNLGGKQLEVAGLMGPGVDPHLYTFVPADVERLNRADIIFYSGLHLEGRMVDLFEHLASRKPTVAVTQGLVEAKDPRLRRPPQFEGYYDPHVWHDPQLWAECVRYVAEVLSSFDPTHRADYASRRDAYLDELRVLDDYCRQQLATVPSEQRVLVSTHDAFGYFCTAYGLTSMPLKGVSTEDEATIGRTDDVVRLLVERQVRAVFVETATSPQLMRALVEQCRRAGHEVRLGGELYADALGPASSGAESYLGMIRTNVDTIVAALR